jgi:Uma2 family endonuclease
MSQSVAAPPTLLPTTWTVADLRDHLGGIPLIRIRLYPFPGTATEQDVLELDARENRLCELVDGVLVEKTMGYYEARLALVIGYFLERFLETHDLGIVLGADGMLRLAPRQVRIPDGSFLSWDHFPARVLPAEPIPDLVPDLAVEVLSEGNTRAEMNRKLREYFGAGVRLVWYVDPEARTATVYTAVDQGRTLTEDEALDGGEVLPGFHLPLRDLFARAGQRQTP